MRGGTATVRLSVSVPREIADCVGPMAPYGAKIEFLQNSGSVTPTCTRVTGIAYLMFDPEPKVATAAYERFRQLPENILSEAFDEGLDQPVVDFLVREHHSFTKLLGKVILKDLLSEDAFHFLVVYGSDQAIDTVRRRNMNFLNSPDVIEHLFRNAKVRKGTIDRILAILGLEVRVSEEEAEPPKRAAAPSPAGARRPPAGTPPLAGEEAEAAGGEQETPYIPPGRRGGPAMLEEEDGDQGFDLSAFRSFFEGEEFSFAEELLGDGQRELTEAEKESLFRQVSKMPVPQKIVLALRGNRDARNLLIRDGNRLLPLYVLQNKGITEEEILQISMNRSASRDLIVEITKNREWTRNYKVRRELAMNPKTPLDKALVYLYALSARDIREVARSKNVPTSLAIAAQRLVKKKRETGTID